MRHKQQDSPEHVAPTQRAKFCLCVLAATLGANRTRRKPGLNFVTRSLTPAHGGGEPARAPPLPMQRVGAVAFNKVDKINSELFSLTYGAIVTQLLKDYEEVDATSAQLEKMGYNIGVRLVDEFLAKAQIGTCQSFQETGEVIAKAGFKMFLGVSAEVVGASETEFRLQLTENPLAEFVELPEQYSSLAYSNLLCGVLRGALEMVQMRVECTLTKDTLWGHEVMEIHVVLKEMLAEEYQDDDD